MTINLNVLARHRDTLLLAEVAAWLHNIKQGGRLRASLHAQTPEPKSTRLSQLAQEVIYEQHRKIRSASRPFSG